MKVSVVRGGGLSGLVTTTTVDAGSLAPGDAETLGRIVGEADPFEMPDVTSSHATAPDEFQVSVTFEDGGRSRTVTAAEHDLPSAIQALVAWVDSAPGRTEEVGPPGGP